MIELHTMQSTNLDMLTSLRGSQTKSRLDPLASVYIPFVNERDHLGNLVTKSKDKVADFGIKKNSVSYQQNTAAFRRHAASLKARSSEMFSIGMTSTQNLSRRDLHQAERTDPSPDDKKSDALNNSFTRLRKNSSEQLLGEIDESTQLGLDKLNENQQKLNAIDKAAREQLAREKLPVNSMKVQSKAGA